MSIEVKQEGGYFLDTVPLDLIGLLVLLIALSAFFSSAETAFSSVNRIRLRNYVDEKRRGSKNALFITENFDQALSTILIGNNIVNIAAASLSAKAASDLFGAKGLFISTVVMTILIIIFGEILPKSFAKENAENYTLMVSGILLFLMKVFTPITYLLVLLKELTAKLNKNKVEIPTVTEEEIKVLVDLSEEEGVIDDKEKELVIRSLDFNDIIVGEILKPRIDMVAIDVTQSVEEIRDIFLEERYSRIPVYEDNIDNVIGILSETDLFGQLVQQNDVHIRKIMRQPLFVVESMKISSLLPELQKNKIHMAIVVDEFGGTSGLITLEDILEEIVGEIWDEHDETMKYMTQIDEKTYELSSELPLDEFAKLMNIREIDSSYHTLGGWIFESIERVPTVGEQFEYESLTFTISEVENRRIRSIRVEENTQES